MEETIVIAICCVVVVVYLIGLTMGTREGYMSSAPSSYKGYIDGKVYNNLVDPITGVSYAAHPESAGQYATDASAYRAAVTDVGASTLAAIAGAGTVTASKMTAYAASLKKQIADQNHILLVLYGLLQAYPDGKFSNGTVIAPDTSLGTWIDNVNIELKGLVDRYKGLQNLGIVTDPISTVIASS